MIYLLEQRKTVGAFKTIAASNNLEAINSQFNETVELITGGNTKDGTCNRYAKDPNILKDFKIGGTHHNIILRIRQLEEVL